MSNEEALKIAYKLADALIDQCRYMRSIGEEPSELACEAIDDAVRAGWLAPPSVKEERR